MPKSKRSHKRIPKNKNRQITPIGSPAMSQPTTAQPDKPAATVKPVNSAPAVTSLGGNPYVAGEFKAIGIVSGVIIVILVALFFILG